MRLRPPASPHQLRVQILQHLRPKSTTRNLTSIPLARSLKMATPLPLPPLPETTRLTPSLIRLLAGNPSKFTLQGTNTYLLGTGPRRILIDTGEGKPSWLAALQHTLEAENATLHCVLLTHWHRDHVGGVGDVLRTWPGVGVYKHDPDEGEGQLGIVDGQVFGVEGGRVRAVHTPGHTRDHMVFVLEGNEEDGGVFTGDNVLGHGTSVFEDLGEYVRSLERMRGLFGSTSGNNGGGAVRAYPGHGAVVEDGLAKVDEYIRHRALREEQVVQTLRSDIKIDETAAAGDVGAETGADAAGGRGDAWTAMELVKNIYQDVPQSLHPAAAGGVVQILQKLRREGKVVMVDSEGGGGEERWRLAGPAGSAGSAGSGRSAL